MGEMAAVKVLCAAAMVLVAAGASRAQSPGAPPDLDRLRNLIADRVRAESIPSFAVAVVRDGQIVWQEAFGPATSDTPYSLASVTKAITGTALMRLSDRGRLDLDRPANAYLGREKLRSPFWDADGATVRRLANHTAGLTTFYRTCDTERTCSVEDAIAQYGILFHAPGADFDYSNLGYAVLGDVIARVSGRSYAAYLRDEIFQPLKMTTCSVGLSGSPAASAVRCSVHDLALFAQWLMTSSSPLQAALSGPVSASGGQQYAFGWWIQPDYFGFRSVYGSGGTTDSSATFRLVPSRDIAVIALSNTGTNLTEQIADETLAEFLPRLRQTRQQRAAAAAAPAAPRQRPAPSDALVGTWTGFVETPAGKRSLSLDVSASGDVRSAFDGGPLTPFTRGGGVRSRIYGAISGNLRTPEAPPPYDLDMGLELHGQQLFGSATTHVRPGQTGSALSYWVELRKPLPAATGQLHLAVSRPIARVLTAGASERYLVDLAAADRADITIVQEGGLGIATFSPGGQLRRRLVAQDADAGFVLAAETAGTYQIELSAPSGRAAKYAIELDNISTAESRQSGQPAPDTESREQPVSEDDMRILERADAVLSAPEVWNRKDTRICLLEDRTRSLFCALEKAQLDLFGEYRHRAVALQEVRFAIDDVTSGREFEHRLRDYNNLRTTGFADVKRVLTIAKHRVRVRLDSRAAP